MYYGDSRPGDQATDAAMTALYRQLGNQSLPDDPGFDTEAGLRDLTSRIIRRELVQPADVGQFRAEARDDDIRARQKAPRSVKKRGLPKRERRHRFAEYGHKRAMVANVLRWTGVFFSAVAAGTVATAEVLTAHLATAVGAVADVFRTAARHTMTDQFEELLSDKRTVKVLMLGRSGSGKTTMLASLYHHYALGTPGGIRFTTADEPHRELVQLANEARDSSRLLPLGARETTQWKFAVRVESRGRSAEAFTLEYLDYAGEMLSSPDLASVAELDPEFKDGLEAADIVLGVLDGEQLAKQMISGYNGGVVGDLERLLTTLARAGHRNIQLVVTKWDAMQRPDGGRYTVSQVLQKLDKDSGAFAALRRSPRLESLRIIPVAALGLESAGPTANDRTTVKRGAAWAPWNVEIPFLAAIPDILTADVPGLDARRAHAPTPITFPEMTPRGQMIGWIKKAASRRHQRAAPPARLTSDTARSYVVHECYAALKKFEEKTPDSRVLAVAQQ